MKKILVFSVFFICLNSFGQYPGGGQALSNDSTLVTVRGALKGRIINKVFTDTTQANTQRIKFYDGAQIYTNSAGGQLWLRDSTLNKWILAGGGPAGANTWVQFNKNGVLGSSPKFVFDTVTNKLSLPTGNLSVNGNSDFVAGKLKINNLFGLGPVIESTLGGGPLSIVIDSNATSTSNGNVLLFARGTTTKDFPILFFTTYDANTPSTNSAVFVGFDYSTSTHTAGKTLVFTTSGFNNSGGNVAGGHIAIRPSTTAASFYATHASAGNWNVDLDPANQGIVKLRNTIQMNVFTSAGTITLDNSYHDYVYTGSGDVTWTIPTVSGNTGNEWYVKNKGTGTITLTRQGSDQMYSSGLTNTYDIPPGEGAILKNDGTNINVNKLSI